MKPGGPLPTRFGSPPQPPSLAHSHPHLLPGPTDRATELPKLGPRAAAAGHLGVGGTCRISGPTQDHLSQSLYFNGTSSFIGLLLTAAFRPASHALGATISLPLRSGCMHLSTSVPLWNLGPPGTAPAEALGPPCSPSCVAHLGSWPGSSRPRTLPQQPRGPLSSPSAWHKVDVVGAALASEGTLPAAMLLSSHQVALSPRFLLQGHLL